MVAPPDSTDSTDSTASATPTIVVGVDGSEQSQRALEWAAKQAELSGCALEIHTVYRPGYEFATREDVARGMERIVADAEARVARLTPETVVTGHVQEGSPASCLIDASSHADLLVVGGRGLGAIRGKLLGAVSQECVARGHCPVTVVH